MSGAKWKKAEYSSWDDAFHGLVPALRQQSVRVAAYTQALFAKACAVPFGSGSEYSERICPEYEELAYKCGLYHQLGKAQLPPEYQTEQRDFSEEEREAIRKYTVDGRLLVASLQERGNRRWGSHKVAQTEKPTKNIPWLMIRESCQQHMERWNGSGYPAGLRENQISPIAQLVGLARELDAIAAGTLSEDAFGEAMERLKRQSGTAWNPALITVLEQAESECKEIFEKYFHYTRAVPKTVPLVEKRPERPMGLHFRAIPDGSGTISAYEAVPWFKGIASQPEETELTEAICDMLVRAEMVEQVSEYFLYEAADAAVRIENCTLPIKHIILEMIPDFYSNKSHLSLMGQLFTDQPLDRDRLLLTVPECRVLKADDTVSAVLREYLQSGIGLLLDGFHPENFSREALAAYGFRYLRLAPEKRGDALTEKAMRELREAGFAIIGTPQGEAMSEDVLIRAGLIQENLKSASTLF